MLILESISLCLINIHILALLCYLHLELQLESLLMSVNFNVGAFKIKL